MQRCAPIPSGWALDAGGREPTDAKAGHASVVLPFGGLKGSDLSSTMEIMAAWRSGLISYVDRAALSVAVPRSADGLQPN